MFPPAIKEILEGEGIHIRLNAECIAHVKARRDRGPRASAIAGLQRCRFTPVDGCGEAPNTRDLGLENTGVPTDGRGYITVDDQLRTNDPVFGL